MAEEQTITQNEAPETVLRIYEVGYHITPSTNEEDVEKVVADVRAVIEKEGGNFIAEGAPALTRLSYEISIQEDGKRVECDRAYFGWIKFEAPVAAASALEEALRTDKRVIRHIVFQTVREETRARLNKAPTLREVRRTDVLRTTAKREEASSAPVSEADLEKALSDITTE